MRKTIVFSLFLSSLALGLWAQQAMVVDVISNSAEPSVLPTVAVNQRGEVLVVWSGGFQEENAELYFRFQKDGKWGAAKRLSYRSFSAGFPKLRVDQNGNFHMSFHDGTASPNRECWYAWFNPVTETWSTKETPHRDSSNDAWSAIDIDGNTVYLGFYHEHGEPYASDIVIFNKPIGGKWSSEYVDISQDADLVSIHPHFRAKNGNLFAAWMELVGNGWQLWYADKVNGKQVPPMVIGGDHFPDVELDDFAKAGSVPNVHILSYGGRMVYNSRIDGIWNMDTINTTHVSPGFCDLELKNKTLVASFAQRSQESGARDVIALRKRVWNNGWGPWSEVIEIEDSEYKGHTATYPFMAIDGSGYCHVVWIDTVYGQDEVYYTKVKMVDVGPLISVDQTSLSYTAKESGANPATQLFKVKNGGGETLSYAITSNKTWLTVSPASGTSAGEWDDITVSVNVTDLDEGVYSGEIQIADPKAPNSPLKVTVNLTVAAPDLFAPQNFSVQKMDNKALFYRERIHKLTWQANANNKKITKYRIQEVSGGTATQLVEVDTNTLQWTRRNVSRTKAYTYRVVAVDHKGRITPYAEAAAN